jgi:hypothetical protein
MPIIRLDASRAFKETSMAKTVDPDGRQVTRLGDALALALALGGCSGDRAKMKEPLAPTMASTVSYAGIDAELGEHLYPYPETLSVVFIRLDRSFPRRIGRLGVEHP